MEVSVLRYKNALGSSNGFIQAVLIPKADIWRSEEVTETENGPSDQPK